MVTDARASPRLRPSRSAAAPGPARLPLALLAAALLCACSDDPTGPGPASPHAWQTSTPRAEGLDAEALEAASEAADELGFVHALLVVRHGRLVAEDYYNGYGPADAHNVRSVTKSITSALVGIALREGLLFSVEQKAVDFFPEHVSRATDPAKRLITLRHLLQMRAGFDHDHNTYEALHASPDWVAATLALPLLYAPGERFSYNTFETHLLSAILTRVTGTSTRAFAESRLLERLGITVGEWLRDPQGAYCGGSDLHLTPRDLARYGQLYLQGGSIDGVELVPAAWVDASWHGSFGTSDASWGALQALDYGYLWWLGEMAGEPVRMALGHGGQFAMCFPGLDMVVVAASYSELGWDEADVQERAVLDLVVAHVLPAVNGW